MAGLVPTQLGNAINRPTGSSALSTDEAAPSDSFAAVLSGHFSRGHVSTTALAAVKLTALGTPDQSDGLEELLPAATKQSERWPLDGGKGPGSLQLTAATRSGLAPFDTEEGSEKLPLATSGLDVVNAVPGGKITPRLGQGPATSPNGPLATTGDPVTQPASSVADEMTIPADHTGIDAGSPASKGNVPATPQDANAVVAIISEADLALPLANTGDSSSKGATAALLPAVPSGKKSDGSTGTHIRTHRLSGEHSIPAAQQQVADVAPDGVSAAAASAPQLPVGTISPPTPVPPPPASDHLVTAAAQITVDSGRQPTAPERPAADDQGKAQSANNQPSAVISPPGTSLTTIEPQKFADRSVPMSETLPLTTQAEMPQVPAPVTVASPPPSVHQAQPAAPVDQIAPALVGILQKTDGQQSVTIRLQPAELGQVQIRIDQTNAGAAHINIIAERPETLQLLQRDEPRLQQTLDQAGVLSSGRTVSFQVATPPQVGASASRPDSMETGSGTFGQGQSGGAWRQSGDSPNDFGRGSGGDQGQTRTRWFRAGLDITA